MNTNEPNSHSESWGKYWHGTGTAGAFSTGGANHPGIQVFWSDFFQSVTDRWARPRLLDVASGNGAVVQSAQQMMSDKELDITCVDISDAAIKNVVARFPGVTGIVSDARSIPLDDQSFDIVTSQFGVEYAGPDAIPEVARLVAPGGALAFLMHIENGSIHEECADSLAAILETLAAEFVPRAIDLFTHGFAAVRGADRAPYDVAGATLAPAVAAVEKIMADYGDDVAGGTIARLYDDVARIHGRMPHYDPNDVLGWLGTMEAELHAYGERMSSMMAAASDKAAFEKVGAQLQHSGLRLGLMNELLVGNERSPLAWALIATRAE